VGVVTANFRPWRPGWQTAERYKADKLTKPATEQWDQTRGSPKNHGVPKVTHAGNRFRAPWIACAESIGIGEAASYDQDSMFRAQETPIFFALANRVGEITAQQQRSGILEGNRYKRDATWGASTSARKARNSQAASWR
jgi:hypothetical protein